MRKINISSFYALINLAMTFILVHLKKKMFPYITGIAPQYKVNVQNEITCDV